MPKDFYHSTIQYETSFQEDANSILEELQNTIVDTFRLNHNKDEVIFNGNTLNISSVSLHSLKVEGREFSFRIHLSLEGSDPTKYARMAFSPLIKSYLGSPYKDSSLEDIEYKAVTIEEVPHSSILGDPIQRDNLEKVLFPTPFPEGFHLKSGHLMIISKQLEKRILDFADGTRGFPAKLSNNFWRMFYLSTVTITTLGYGDILPITATARILISIESIMGIVVIGLFLNALAHRSKDST